MEGLLSSDHFQLGLGLAAGPAIIVCFAVFAFFKWGKIWKSMIPSTDRNSANNPINANCTEHIGLVKDIAFAASECKSIWLEIRDINIRQMSLREKLPGQYVSRDDLKGIQDRLQTIDKKLDRYLELSVLKH